MCFLKKKYEKNIVNNLKKKIDVKNCMAIPKIKKVVISMGISKAILDKKHVLSAIDDLERISGQKPVLTEAKKSISSFKLRKGFKIGCKVTLRRNKMYEFLDRLINISLPRIRDFRGISKKSFDNMGNYNLGIKENIIFPEIDYNKISSIRGLNINIIIKSKSKQESILLLKEFNFPLGA